MLGQIVPVVDINKANRNLRKKNSDLCNIEIPANIEQIDIQYLEEDYKATIETKNRFEDKAKTIIAALTIAITLILNLSKMIDTIITNVPFPYFNYVIFLLAIVSILYMVIAGIMSIQVLIKENLLYSITLDDRTNKNKKGVYQKTQQNINQNLIRNNIIYAAYLSIRNSVICLLIIFGLAIYPYQDSESGRVNINIEKGIIYDSTVVDWIVENPEKDINFGNIVEIYKDICNDGTERNIYDKKQKIVFTVEILNTSYYISDIKTNINESN